MTSHTSTSSIADQRTALLRGVATYDRTDTSTRIEHRGADVLDLLHRLTTNDLLSLQDGESRPTIFCSEKGRVTGLFTVLRRTANDFLLTVDSADASRLVEEIDRYTIIEDAELRDVTAGTFQLSVAGPDAPRIVDSAELHDVTLVRHTWPQDSHRIDIVGPLADRDEIAARLESSGATHVTAEAWDLVRIEQGVPGIYTELDERSNPLEAGLEALINFDKGCYIGQEVVARLDTYDKLQRRLVGLRSDQPLRAGTDLIVDGRSVGRITSAAESPEFGPIALAYVRKGHWEPGTTLDAGGVSVTIAELPFA